MPDNHDSISNPVCVRLIEPVAIPNPPVLLNIIFSNDIEEVHFATEVTPL